MGGGVLVLRRVLEYSLCGFDDVPGAVVIHVAFAGHALSVAMVVVTLGLDFLGGGDRAV